PNGASAVLLCMVSVSANAFVERSHPSDHAKSGGQCDLPHGAVDRLPAARARQSQVAGPDGRSGWRPRRIAGSFAALARRCGVEPCRYSGLDETAAVPCARGLPFCSPFPRLLGASVPETWRQGKVLAPAKPSAHPITSRVAWPVRSELLRRD